MASKSGPGCFYSFSNNTLKKNEYVSKRNNFMDFQEVKIVVF
jgi:hypothetical protein